jgi:tetratricopeptide (TPR) repeat protein
MSGDLERAEALAAEGRHADALELLVPFTNDRSFTWEVGVLAARSLRAVGRAADALVQADRAVAAAPTVARPRTERARCLAVLGRYAAAEDAAREALGCDPYDLGALLVAADASERADRGDRALAYGQQAVTIAPDDPTALCAYGIGLHACGRWPEAEAVWRAILLRAPGDPTAIGMLVLALSRQGRTEEARVLGEGAVVAATADPEAVATLGRAYRPDTGWLVPAAVIVVPVLFLALGSTMGPVGTVLLGLVGLAYAALRRRHRSRRPVTPEGRAIVEHLDRRTDRAVAGFAGAFAIAVGLAWFTRSPSGLPTWVAGTVLCLGGLAGVGMWWRTRPDAPEELS